MAESKPEGTADTVPPAEEEEMSLSAEMLRDMRLAINFMTDFKQVMSKFMICYGMTGEDGRYAEMEEVYRMLQQCHTSMKQWEQNADEQARMHGFIGCHCHEERANE